MNNRLERTLAFIFLLVILLLTWYLFLYDDFVTESEEKLTGIFASLAVGFGIFQFWINDLHAERKKLYDLRNEAYKEFILLIDQVSGPLIFEMTGNEVNSMHNQINRLMNNINRIESAISMNSDYLFPGLYFIPETEPILNIMGKILHRTDEFRLDFERAFKESNQIARDFKLSTERMNWQNEVRIYLKELHKSKYDFYRVLRDYL